jgi:hypothetical protein
MPADVPGARLGSVRIRPVLLVILAFVAGVGVGILYARSRPVGGRTDAAPERATAVTPLVPGALGPNRKGRKAGLTPADFTPSDDILERLRRAEAGELDPSELAPDDGASGGAHETEPAARSPEPDAPSTPDPAAMTDAERRVLDRLRRMSAEEPADD